MADEDLKSLVKKLEERINYLEKRNTILEKRIYDVAIKSRDFTENTVEKVEQNIMKYVKEVESDWILIGFSKKKPIFIHRNFDYSIWYGEILRQNYFDDENGLTVIFLKELKKNKSITSLDVKFLRKVVFEDETTPTEYPFEIEKPDLIFKQVLELLREQWKKLIQFCMENNIFLWYNQELIINNKSVRQYIVETWNLYDFEKEEEISEDEEASEDEKLLEDKEKLEEEQEERNIQLIIESE